MPYFLLLAGIVIIFASFKKDNMLRTNKKNQCNIENLLEKGENLDVNALEGFQYKFNELYTSIEEIEKALLLLSEEITEIKHSITNKDFVREENIDIENSKELYLENTEVDNVEIKANDNLKSDMVYALHSEGKSIDEICTTLGIGKGEALLRIGLKKQRK